MRSVVVRGSVVFAVWLSLAVHAMGEPKVRMVYLVPSDQETQFHYQLAIQDAAENLQRWYRNELGGATFLLNKPVVEVLVSPHDAAWYASNPNGPDHLWFWNNVLDDAGPLTGWSFNDPENRWVFYIDAFSGCGQLGGAGTSGVVVIGRNDLRGLTGEETVNPCPGAPDTAGRCRWVGGLGHELGHAFNIPHPPACDQGLPSCPSNALMWLGFRTYPDAFLLPEDVATLDQSPFIVPTDLPDGLPPCDVIAPKITLAVNGDPSSDVETTSPARVGLTIDPGTHLDPVAWFYAIVPDGIPLWITSSGISSTPSPLAIAPAVEISDLAIWDAPLPPSGALALFFFMVDANGLVAVDVITATTAPP